MFTRSLSILPDCARRRTSAVCAAVQMLSRVPVITKIPRGPPLIVNVNRDTAAYEPAGVFDPFQVVSRFCDEPYSYTSPWPESATNTSPVWRDADLDAAACALTECFYGSSQICMVPKYAIVHPEAAETFVEELVGRVRALRPGFPEDPETLLSPVLKADRFYDFLSEARGQGCELLCGGRRIDVDGAPSATGLFFEPTVIRVPGLELAGRLSCVREETFFPLLPVVVPKPTADEQLLENVVDFLNANEYGLRNSVWTSSDEIGRRFARDVLNGGLLKINDSHIGFTSYLSTHGGTRRTGGPFGELNYVGLRTTHLQGICWGDGNPQPLAAELLDAVPA
jgi:hypothetical protein